MKEGPEFIVTREEVVSALKMMSNGKAVGQLGVANESSRSSSELVDRFMQ